MGIRVQTIGVGLGAGADLTDQADGLVWSSINPGGDERATFRVKRQWFAGAPEIAQGNLLRISDGPSVLWQGRIEEQDRSAQDAEAIQVTAYGLGTRLKDSQMHEVYVDSNPAGWGDMPLNEKVRQAARPFDFTWFTWTQDSGGLLVNAPNQAAPVSVENSTWYTAPTGVGVAKVMYKGKDTTIPGTWQGPLLLFSVNDLFEVGTETIALTLDDTLRTAASTSKTMRRAWFTLSTGGAVSVTPGAGTNRAIKAVAVYGNHGLTTRAIGSSTPDGLLVSDVVADIVGRGSGIVARRIDATSFVVPHLVFYDPVTLEAAVIAADAFQGNDWGVWGPESPFDPSLDGYFDYKARDTVTPHWTCRRADCDDVELNTEFGTLYDSVDVTYTDPTTPGVQIVTRSATVQALADAGVSRKARLDAGENTPLGAQQLGDTFLGLTNQQTPARGSVKLSVPLSHYLRGSTAPHFMRADGSNIRIQDVLPSKDALSISATPDRRTMFPIKRVEVDASGERPITSVEVDQSRDLLSILNARLAVVTQSIAGR